MKSNLLASPQNEITQAELNQAYDSMNLNWKF